MGISFLFFLTLLLSYVNQAHLQIYHPRDISRGQQNKELLRKNYFLQLLNDLFEKSDTMNRETRKRSCNVNLGFHCQTDEYSSIADMFDFLQSSLSPGKRKRNLKILSIEGS